MNLSEESLKKIETVQYDLYKKVLRFSRSTPNIAIIMELIKVKYKIMEIKLIEYQSILQMEEKIIVNAVTEQAERIGAKTEQVHEESRMS